MTKKRVAIKCIVEYDFEESLSDNIEAMLSRIEFSGDTEYVLCMERTLQNKPWDMLKKGLMVDLDCFKEEFLEHIIIERELYFLVPRSCRQFALWGPRPSQHHESLAEEHTN